MHVTSDKHLLMELYVFLLKIEHQLKVLLSENYDCDIVKTQLDDSIMILSGFVQ